MTKQCVNFTGRKRLMQNHFLIALRRQGGEDWELAFSLETNLAESPYHLPPEALIIVEAYERSNVKRFHFGTVGNVQQPRDCSLASFSPDRVKFRIKVVATRQCGFKHGLVLAHADGVKPNVVGAPKRALLPVLASDLGPSVWELRWEGEDEEPVLYVHENLGRPELFLKNPTIRAFLLPAILQLILERLGQYHCKGLTESEDDFEVLDEEGYATHWTSEWLAFFKRENPEPPPKEEGAFRDWTLHTLRSFCRKRKLLNDVTKELLGE